MKSKVLSIALLAAVIFGSLFASSDIAIIKESSLMTKLFLGFFATIVLLQIIPGVLLFAGLMKGIFASDVKAQDVKEKG